MSIVVGYSANQYGQAALDHAAEMAREGSEHLLIVNATTGTSLVDPRFAADDTLTGVVDRVRESGVDVEVRHEVVLDVADAVLSAAEEVDARLIVVGVRRRTPVGKLLMGSVAQRVILDAECPVLTVKPPR